jgi:methyl-accepting chemotaxis protein
LPAIVKFIIFVTYSAIAKQKPKIKEKIMKISFKLTAIMVTLSLFSVASVGITLLLRSRSAIYELSEKYTGTIARESASQVSKILEAHRATTKTASQMLNLYETMLVHNRRNMCNAMLQGILKENPELVATWCLWEPDVLEGNDMEYLGKPGTTPEGRFAPYWRRSGEKIELDILTDYDIPGAGDYYLLARNSGRVTVLDPYFYNIGGKDVLISSIAAPILGSNGEVLGVVGVDFDVTTFQKISQSNKPYPDALAAVFSNNGTVIAHFDESHIGKSLESERNMTGSYFDTFVKAVKTGESLTFYNYVKELKENLGIFVVPITVEGSDTPWSYAVAIYEKTMMNMLNAMLSISIAISFMILAIVSVAAIILSRTISKPIVKVTETLKDISEGEGDLTRSIQVNSKDEIGSLAHYFNETLDKIKKMIIVIKNETTGLSHIGTDLSSNMTETAAAINQITSNIQSIEGQVINQSASVTETNATMEQVVTNIKKLNGHVECQSDSVGKASSAIEEMVANIQSVTQTLLKNAKNVKELKEASEVGRVDMQDVAADIKEIVQDSEGLLQINSVIQDIASQTNLLSMNAAIEAAHAGEAGRGFAVVAEEIRKLAEISGEQSKTITLVLKKIRGSIDKITSSSGNALSRFEVIDAGVKVVAEQEENIIKAMKEQETGTQQVLNGVVTVTDITRQVRSGSEEMLEGSEEVIHESQNLEKVTQEITGGIHEMASGAQQINTAVNHVNEISGENRERIKNLMRQVELFKVE